MLTPIIILLQIPKIDYICLDTKLQILAREAYNNHNLTFELDLPNNHEYVPLYIFLKLGFFSRKIYKRVRNDNIIMYCEAHHLNQPETTKHINPLSGWNTDNM